MIARTEITEKTTITKIQLVYDINLKRLKLRLFRQR